jgi:Fe-S cluster assembly scaffold protein SufB
VIKTAVRPRTGVIQEANTSYISNYIIMSEVQDLQANPISYLNGDNAKFYSQTLVYGKGKSKIDLGARAVLNGNNTHATLISKIIGDNEARYCCPRGDNWKRDWIRRAYRLFWVANFA